MNRISFLNRGYAFKGLLAVLFVSVAKTNVLIRCAAQCFDFANAKVLFSYDAAHLWFTMILFSVCHNGTLGQTRALKFMGIISVDI